MFEKHMKSRILSHMCWNGDNGNEKREKEFSSMNIVFGELLYSILMNVDSQNLIQSCRRVSKMWSLTVNKIMLERGNKSICFSYSTKRKKYELQKKSRQFSFSFIPEKFKGHEVKTLENFNEFLSSQIPLSPPPLALHKTQNQFPVTTFEFEVNGDHFTDSSEIQNFFSINGSNIQSLVVKNTKGSTIILNRAEILSLILEKLPCLKSLHLLYFPSEHTARIFKHFDHNFLLSDGKLCKTSRLYLKSVDIRESNVWLEHFSEIPNIARCLPIFSSCQALATCRCVQKKLDHVEAFSFQRTHLKLVPLQKIKNLLVEPFAFEPNFSSIKTMENLLKMDLTGVECLRLTIGNPPTSQEMARKSVEILLLILNKIKDSLKTLELFAASIFLFKKIPVPILSQVEKIWISPYHSSNRGINSNSNEGEAEVEEEEEDRKRLRKCVPIEYFPQNYWFNINEICPNVHIFHYDRHIKHHPKYRDADIEEEDEILHISYHPNVKEFRIGCGGDSTGGLVRKLIKMYPTLEKIELISSNHFKRQSRHIWKLKNLRHLTLQLNYCSNYRVNTAPRIESAFTGFSEETVRKLKRRELNTVAHELFYMDDLRESSSILELTKLETLKLDVFDCGIWIPFLTPDFISPEITGQWAFLPMQEKLKVQITVFCQGSSDRRYRQIKSAMESFGDLSNVPFNIVKTK